MSFDTTNWDDLSVQKLMNSINHIDAGLLVSDLTIKVHHPDEFHRIVQFFDGANRLIGVTQVGNPYNLPDKEVPLVDNKVEAEISKGVISFLSAIREQLDDIHGRLEELEQGVDPVDEDEGPDEPFVVQSEVDDLRKIVTVFGSNLTQLDMLLGNHMRDCGGKDTISKISQALGGANLANSRFQAISESLAQLRTEVCSRDREFTRQLSVLEKKLSSAIGTVNSPASIFKDGTSIGEMVVTLQMMIRELEEEHEAYRRSVDLRLKQIDESRPFHNSLPPMPGLPNGDLPGGWPGGWANAEARARELEQEKTRRWICDQAKGHVQFHTEQRPSLTENTLRVNLVDKNLIDQVTDNLQKMAEKDSGKEHPTMDKCQSPDRDHYGVPHNVAAQIDPRAHTPRLTLADQTKEEAIDAGWMALAEQVCAGIHEPMVAALSHIDELNHPVIKELLVKTLATQVGMGIMSVGAGLVAQQYGVMTNDANFEQLARSMRVYGMAKILSKLMSILTGPLIQVMKDAMTANPHLLKNPRL